MWAVSTLIFLLTVTLGFMLFRNFVVKLYVERHSNREGSRIRTKVVVGALALSFMPVVFLVLFSVAVLNTNINKWFSRPGELINTNYINLGNAIESAARDRAQAEAIRLALRRMHTSSQQASLLPTLENGARRIPSRPFVHRAARCDQNNGVRARQRER